GYKNICELLTQAHLRSEKGKCAVRWSELGEFSEGVVALFGWGRAGASPALSDASPDRKSLRRGATNSGRGARAPQNFSDRAQFVINVFGRENVFVEIQRHFIRGEEKVNRGLVDLARANRLSILATNGVQYAKPYGREVLD